MFIQVQETPNPVTLKFLPGQKLLEDSSRTYEFTSVSEAKQSPLALQLMRIQGVKSVFFGEDFVTVTKSDPEEEWAVLKPDIFATIMQFLQSDKPIFTDPAALASQPTDTS
jgi:hypothetical protein